MDFKINYQQIRHMTMARVARSLLYRILVGPNEWPLRFKRPGSFEAVRLGLSPHLYVHIPFCQTICPHCPYNKRRFDEGLYKNYRVALLEEIQTFVNEQPHHHLESLYFGGGSPSLTPDLVEEVIHLVANRISTPSEIGVEVHPAHATWPELRRLKSMGVNRISLGIESFNEDLLRKLGRGYSRTQAIKAIETAKSAGFECVDVNLIYGIPGQVSHEVIADTLLCTNLEVDQISAYPLISFIHTPLGKQVAEGKIEQYGVIKRLRVQQEVSKLCLGAGYRRTSVWSYTKPGVTPYSTVTRDDYLGFGAGAASKVDGVFWFNTFSVEEYVKIRGRKPALVMNATARLQKIHWIYWQIYKTRINFAEYRRKFGADFKRDFYLLNHLLWLLRWGKPSSEGLAMTETGVIWAHKLQTLYSLSYIDKLWQICQNDPWPEEVILE